VLRRLAFFAETLGHVTFLGIVAVLITQVDVKIGAGHGRPGHGRGDEP
jgi:ABC-type Mn2+/Zn2+ transport system permease subunit